MFVIWDALRRDAIDRLAGATVDAHRLEQLLVITNTWAWQQGAATAILADLQAAPPEAAASRDWMAAWLAQAPARDAYADQQDAVAARLGVQHAREIAQERVSPVFTAAKQRGRQLLSDRSDARADHAQRRAPSSAAGAVAGPTMADELGKLAALHAAGALTDAEFTRAKARLLDT